MINIYGVKMVNLSDILQYTGRPKICDYIKDNEYKILNMMSEDEILEIDTSLEGNFPVYNIVKAYRLLFIPIELVEEKLIYAEVTNTLSILKEKFMTLERIDKVEKIMLDFETEYDRVRDKLSGENIVDASCFMLVYDDNELKNVYIAVPRVIINKVLTGRQQYECNDCGKIIETHNHEYESFIPDLYYEKYDNEIKYYCTDCKEHHANAKHVGE